MTKNKEKLRCCHIRYKEINRHLQHGTAIKISYVSEASNNLVNSSQVNIYRPLQLYQSNLKFFFSTKWQQNGEKYH